MVGKEGSTYDAAVILDDTGGRYINFKLEFPKRKAGGNADKTIPDFVFPPGGEKPDMSRDDLAAVAEAVAALSPEPKPAGGGSGVPLPPDHGGTVPGISGQH